MNLLEVERTATVAWSSLSNQTNLMAVGTMAGTLDMNFDTTANLEIVQLDVSTGKSNVVGTTSVAERFNKLTWGAFGANTGVHSSGVIAGGLANGSILVWDAAKIIKGNGDNAVVATCDKHTSGPVNALDFNPNVHNLLASGANDSEIYIWDLSTPTPTVYNPGPKTQHQHADNPITVVQWNKKSQPILASVSHNGVTLVWDLRVKRHVLQFSNPSKKLRCRAMAWNPDEPTQLVTASEMIQHPSLTYGILRTLMLLQRYWRGILLEFGEFHGVLWIVTYSYPLERISRLFAGM